LDFRGGVTKAEVAFSDTEERGRRRTCGDEAKEQPKKGEITGAKRYIRKEK